MHTIRPNATPPCGPFCVNLYSQEFGPHMTQAVNPAVSKVGARIVLSPFCATTGRLLAASARTRTRA
jgi:hypothetical protein